MTSNTPQRAARPRRLQIQDESGRPRTLDAGCTAFECVCRGTGSNVLLLGLGPDPAYAVELVAREHVDATVTWLESAAFVSQMPPAWRASIPADWGELAHQAVMSLLDEDLSRYAVVWRYRAGTRLFPSFWGPLLGHIHAQQLGGALRADVRPDKRVLLPGASNQLLTQEIESAFTALGYTPVRLPDGDLHAVAAALRQGRPSLYFSVNLRGLDADGHIAQMLLASGVPVGSWFVDNPWHILSRLRLPWWRELCLFVTDASFVKPLRNHGAQHVHVLPLAAWFTPETRPRGKASVPAVDTVFVGRSAFPDKDGFFRACTVPDALMHDAHSMLAKEGTGATVPHVQWWEQALHIERLWPDVAVRSAGLGAETCSQARRALWLNAAAAYGLNVYGDEGWKGLLPPHVPVLPPVDYYTSLPDVYAAARVTLNVTSLLLPCGLTQRHFDVWMSGGFLLTDATLGLALFPEELTAPIRVLGSRALPAALERLEQDRGLRIELAGAWRKHISAKHTYVQRMIAVLKCIKIQR